MRRAEAEAELERILSIAVLSQTPEVGYGPQRTILYRLFWYELARYAAWAWAGEPPRRWRQLGRCVRIEGMLLRLTQVTDEWAREHGVAQRSFSEDFSVNPADAAALLIDWTALSPAKAVRAIRRLRGGIDWLQQKADREHTVQIR